MNEPSSLLSEEENQIVFTVIGQRRQTKATAVVQMFHANPNPNQWTKFRTGVVCFVKDNGLKSYFIRLIDISARTVIFEQELYDLFKYNADKPYFHSFPGDKFMVGLNFANNQEATKFRQAVETKIQYARRTTMKSQPNRSDSVGVPPPQKPATMIGRPPVNVSTSDPYTVGDKKGKPQAPKGGKKITKADIGMPTDFRHLAHVGWDPNTGAFNSSNISPDWKNLLDKVGVTEDQLKDKDTAKFIYDFVEKNGGIQEANRQLEASGHPHGHRGAPPPPPSRGGGRGPPPPPPRGGPPPPPGGGNVPPPGGGNVPPPPPPPPPPPHSAPAPPPPLPGGRGGPPPPPPSSSKPSSSLPVVDEARGNLMASIRTGFQLKHVSEDTREEDTDKEGIGMAGALARALEMRAKVIQDESDDDDDEDFDEDDEWD